MSKIIHICQDTKPRKNNIIPKCNLSHFEQTSHLGQLYLLNNNKCTDNITEKIKRSIEIKINNYKQQDIKKNRDISNIISYEDSILKLLLSKLICYYCSEYMTLTYENVRQPEQWTFDRIDNNISHTNDNIVVCCLKCNMKRKTLNSDNFKMSTNLKIKKINN